jgi:hypothetical protein
MVLTRDRRRTGEYPCAEQRGRAHHGETGGAQTELGEHWFLFLWMLP